MKLASLILLLSMLVFAWPMLVEGQNSDAPLWCTYEPPTELDNGKRVVLIAGDDEYRSEEALPMLGKILCQRLGYHCTVLFPIDEATGEIKPDYQTNIPGMQHLQDADLAIIGLRFRALPDEQMKYFDEYLMAGKPIIALRTSTHSFRFPDDFETSYRHYHWRAKGEWNGGFGKHVLGETWVNHHGDHGSQSTRGVLNSEAQDSPILTGVKDVWGPTDVYGVRKLPQGSKVLLYGQVIDGMSPKDDPVEGSQNEPMMPLAWIRSWKTPDGNDCPIFCTTMGSSTDVECADLRRLIVNAALQMTGNADQIDADLNVDYVDPYRPTQFGFGTFQKGKKPSDYDLQKRD